MRKWMIKTLLIMLCAMPLVQVASAASSITVQLSNYIGNPTSLNVVLRGAYTVTKSTVNLAAGTTYTLKSEDGYVKIYQGNTLLRTLTYVELNPGTSNTYLELNGRKYLGTVKVVVENGKLRPYNTLDFETYLKGVVPSEMGNGWGNLGGLEALKAQAVAARTYAYKSIGSTITDTQTHQVYGGYFPDYSYSNAAVDGTQGQIATFNKNTISALYSSSNGGYIESNTGAWGSTLVPYLAAKADKFDPVNAFSYSISTTDLVEKLKTKIKTFTPVSFVTVGRWGVTDGNRIDTLRFSLKDTNGVNQQFDISTDSFRALLGGSNIKSLYLDAPVFAPNDKNTIIFSGKGFGHGVGMSQYGALKMAQLGYDYKNILGFYYPGTQLFNGSTYTNLVYSDNGNVTAPTQPTTPTSPNGSYITYVVQPGDYLSTIAIKYNTTYQAIMDLNGLKTTTIYPGDILKIPTTSSGTTSPTSPTPSTPSTTTPSTSTTITYTVKSGDTLSKIAAAYKTTVTAIKTLNNLKSDTIYVNQTLKISTTTATTTSSTKAVYYTVKKGDTLYGIASKYSTTVDAIKKLSKITSNTLSIGQVLRVK
ncbi:hypothetical protein CN918_26060 [Priestia megaterium]|nr:hypothetical protein CN918_26060 [Priestia megaterium]